MVSNLEKDELVPTLLEEQDPLHTLPEAFHLESSEVVEHCRPAITGASVRTRAFIKVQDGCANRCAFCVSTLARGPARSRSINDILKDIRAASGSKEIVLTGLHLGSWGRDFSPPLHLRHLVQAILHQTEVPRLRLSSLEPWDLEAEFFQLWENPRLCQHLHLPLQSGCAATLRRMARKTTPEAYAELVAVVRKAMPTVAITTDIITGFPGESEAEFLESLEFVCAMRFAGGHVFTYSARPETTAARMPDQVPVPVRKERNALIRHTFAEAARAYQASFINEELAVLWESAVSLGSQGWKMSGLTENYLRVNANAAQDLWNQITPVHLTNLIDGHIEGEIPALAPHPRP